MTNLWTTLSLNKNFGPKNLFGPFFFGLNFFLGPTSFLWKRLLTGTLPVNNYLLTGTVPANKSLLTGTVSVNNSLLTGIIPVNNYFWTTTIPIDLSYPSMSLIQPLSVCVYGTTGTGPPAMTLKLRSSALVSTPTPMGGLS